MKRILIVEDDFYISKLYQRTFTLAGFTVDTAMSGNQALEKSKTETYDVIMLDVMLGDMSGLDVLKLWRAPDHPFKSIPVFLSTNRGEDTIVKQGFAIGMEGYFYKSQYVPQDLVNEINSFFSRQGEVPDGTSQGDVPPGTSQGDVPPGTSQSDVSGSQGEVPDGTSQGDVPPGTSQGEQASAVSPPAVADTARLAVEPIISSAIPTVMPVSSQSPSAQSGPVPPVGSANPSSIIQPPVTSPYNPGAVPSPYQSVAGGVAPAQPPNVSQYPPQGGTVQYPPQSYYVAPVTSDPLARAVPGMPPPLPAQPPSSGTIQYPPPPTSATHTPPQGGAIQYPPQGSTVQYPPQQPSVVGNQPSVAAAASPSPQEGTIQYPPQGSTVQYPPQGGAVQYPPQSNTAGKSDFPPYTNGISPKRTS